MLVQLFVEVPYYLLIKINLKFNLINLEYLRYDFFMTGIFWEEYKHDTGSCSRKSAAFIPHAKIILKFVGRVWMCFDDLSWRVVVDRALAMLLRQGKCKRKREKASKTIYTVDLNSSERPVDQFLAITEID